MMWSTLFSREMSFTDPAHPQAFSSESPPLVHLEGGRYTRLAMQDEPARLITSSASTSLSNSRKTGLFFFLDGTINAKLGHRMPQRKQEMTAVTFHFCG